jgi:hypothetical protein
LTLEKIIKIIETSTVKSYDYSVKRIETPGHLWKLSGNIPGLAIEYLQKAGYTCYLSNDEFFVTRFSY